MPFALLAGAAGPIIGAAIGAGGSLGAANVAAGAANRAADLQQQRFEETRTSLAPFVQAGTTSLSALQQGLGTGGGGFDPTAPLLRSPLADMGPAPVYNMPAFGADQYHQSPGYQWELSQGLNAVQNKAVPGGGALSGNMLKALQTFGTGLADQDYWKAYNAYAQDYLNQYQSKSGNYWNTANFEQAQQGNQFNRLAGLVGTGINAATQTGQIGGQAATNQGNALYAAGTQQARGISGVTNALTGGVTDLTALYGNPYNAGPYGANPAGGYAGSSFGNINYYGPGVNPNLYGA